MRRLPWLLTALALGVAACAPAGTPTPVPAVAATQTQVVPAASPTVVASPTTAATATATVSAPTTTPSPEPPEQPGPRAGADMAFHAGLGQVVMVNGSPTDNRVWGWDGAAWQVVGEGGRAENGPAARELGGVAYDAARDVLVLYGGRTNNGTRCLSDTWEWDGQTWTEFTGTSPAVCSHFMMEYAAGLGRVVVFGGADDALGTHAGMWAWDGAAWEPLAVDTPEVRFHGMSAVDPAGDRLWLLGGFDLSNQMVDEWWAWDGALWEQLPLDGPPALSHAKLVYDAARAALVLVGGTTQARTPFVFQTDTWLFADGVWSALEGPAALARGAPGAAYDPVRERVVVYGGFDNAAPRLADTWEWDGAGWQCAAGCE